LAADCVEFQFALDRWYRWMAAPLRLGPKRASIWMSATHLHVKLGWAFEVDIPLTSVTEIRRGQRVIDGWGARGRQGIWVVNGSSNDIVEVAIDPPIHARAARRRVEVQLLRISVSGPDSLIEALRARKGLR
jgi:hypothetical protein